MICLGAEGVSPQREGRYQAYNLQLYGEYNAYTSYCSPSHLRRLLREFIDAEIEASIVSIDLLSNSQVPVIR